MNVIPDQKWCGQSQPHAQHVWTMRSGMTGVYVECAGHLGEGKKATSEYRNDDVLVWKDGQPAGTVTRQEFMDGVPNAETLARLNEEARKKCECPCHPARNDNPKTTHDLICCKWRNILLRSANDSRS